MARNPFGVVGEAAGTGDKKTRAKLRPGTDAAAKNAAARASRKATNAGRNAANRADRKMAAKAVFSDERIFKKSVSEARRGH